jgi:long-subunit fatty acid transport protein
VGAIVLEPVLLEVVNQSYWPDFPWQELAPLYDVWLPMSYWTNRNESSGFRDGFAYTDENIRRLRNNLGDDTAKVHPVGGIGEDASAADYDGFVLAAEQQQAIGWSVYDFNVTASSVWPRLRK